MRTQPSEKDYKVLDFMSQFCLDNYMPPSTREIANAFETSTSVAIYYIDRLVRFGLVKKVDGIARGAVPVYIIEIFEKEKKAIND